MRLLVFPSYEYPNVNADSSYTMMKAFIQNAVHADPNLHVYWVLPKLDPPKKMYRWKFDPNEWTHPQVTQLPALTIKGRDLNEALFGPELFELVNPYNGEYCFWDAVLTNNAGKAAHIVRLIEFMGRPRPPVYVWEFSPKLMEHSENNNDGSLQALYDNYGCNANPDVFTHFQSEWTKKQTIQSARNLLSATSIAQFRKNADVFHGAVDMARMKQVAAQLNGKKFPKLTLYFGGRFTAQKRGELIAEIYDYAFCLGKDVDVVITTPTSKNQKIGAVSREASEIKLLEGLSQEQAWEVMLQSHVVICAQKHFAFLPSATLEQIAAGLVVLIYDNHVDTALGPEPYPFLYKDKSQCLALLKEIVRDYPAAQAKMKHAQKYVLENSDFTIAAPNLVSRMRAEVQARQSTLVGRKIYKRDMWGELAQEVAQLPDRGWDKVFEFAADRIPTLTATIDMPLMPGVRRTFWQMYQHLQIRLGDDCSHSKPFFGDKLLMPVGPTQADAPDEEEEAASALPVE